MGMFLIGLVVVLLGVLLVYYSGSLIDMFGRIPWADTNLGGTAQAYVLVGFVVMIVGFCLVLGLFEFSV